MLRCNTLFQDLSSNFQDALDATLTHPFQVSDMWHVSKSEFEQLDDSSQSLFFG